MANKYSKALKHIKSTQIDEKIKKLEEAAPTNSMSGVYALNAPGWHNTKPEPAKVFVPDKDGNWPAGIPANPGDKSYTRPAGYWDGSRDWDYIEKPIASNADIGADGKNTKNLIDDATGYVKTDLPDGTRGFVLGPLVDNFVYLHGYDAYCNIGYMQKDTRQFVLLGRVDGRWNTDVHPTPSAYAGYGWGDPRVWDGSESGFTSYNPSFTHAHALWFKEQIESRKYGTNVAYFYSGGVPAQNNPGEYSNLPQWLQDLLNAMKGGLLAGLGKFMDANSAVAGAAGSALGDFMGYGSGGDPNQVGVGDEHTQGDPTTGDSGDANLWGQLAKMGKGAAQWWNKQFDGNSLAALAAKSTWGIMDNILFGRSSYLLKGVPKNYKFNPNFIGAGPKNSAILNAMPKYNGQKLVDWADDLLSVGNFKSSLVKNIVGKNYFGQWFTDPTMVNVATSYAKDGTVSLVPRTGGKWGWKNWLGSNTSRSLAGQPETFQRSEDLLKALKTGKARLDLAVDNPKTQKLLRRYALKVATNSKTLKTFARGLPILGAGISAVDAISRFSKGDWHGGALSILSMVPGPAGWAALGAQVAVDTGAVEKGVEFMYNRQTGFNPETGMFEPKTMKGSRSRFREAVEDQNNKIGNMNLEEAKQQMIKMGVPLDNPEEYANEVGLMMLAGGMNADIVEIMQMAILGVEITEQQQKDIEEKMTKMAGVLVAAQKAKENNYQEPSLYDEDEPWGDIEPQETSESVVLSESRSRILREIKKPVEVKEEPIQKLKKYRPNFKGKYRPQNTPDVTASKKSDELAASGNAKGQAWRTKDKYWSGYETTERMNVIYDRVGHGNQAWEQIIEDARKKNGWKNREVQEQINRYYALEAERKQGLIQETSQTDREDNFDKVVKLKSIIGDLKTWQGDIKPEYPDEKPPKLEKGWHPQYGKDKFNYYKRLDSVSARSMPKTGDPEVDATVDKQKKKKMVQPKVAEDTRSNWRDSLERSNVEEKKNLNESLFKKISQYKENKEVIQEKMANTTSGVFSYSMQSAGNVDLQTFQLGISAGTDPDPMNHGLIHFGAVGDQTDNKVVDGGGEYTVWSNLDDLGNVDDPTDAGGTAVVRAWGTDSFAGGGGHGWLITQPGYKHGMVRNAKPTGDYHGYEYSRRDRLGLPQLQDYDGYWHRYGSTVDEIGKGWASPGWNSDDGTTDRGMGTVLSFDGPGSPRFAALKAVDTTEVDTFKVHAHISDDAITSSYNGVSPEVHVYYWAGDKPGFKGVHDNIYDGERHTSGDGWRPINVKPDGTVMGDVESRLIKFASERLADIPTLDGESNTVAHNKLYPYSIPIPEWCRGKNSRFMIYQRYASTLSATTFRVASIRFQRKNPITITPSLDDPQASSFIRVGSKEGDPRKRRKAVEDQLKASKEYTDHVIGKDFPGSGATLSDTEASPIGKEEVKKKFSA